MKMQKRTAVQLWLVTFIFGWLLHAPLASAVVTTYRNAVIFGTGASSCTGALGKSCSGQNVFYLNSGDGQAHVHLANNAEFAIPQSSVAPGGGYATVSYNDTPQAQQANVNFKGSGVSCTNNAGAHRTDCAVTYPWQFHAYDYGAVCDGTTDDTVALQAAAAACNATAGGTVVLPTGTCVISGSITFHRGCFLHGSGTQGSTVGYGSGILQKANNTNALVWDGNGPTSAAGTGGGADDIFIYKAQGYSGGDGIYIVGTDDNHRPGEMRFRNVLISSENNAALWSRAFHVDGTANTTAGTRGVRSILLQKVRLNACDGNNYPNQCLYLNQVTHFFSDYLEIDPVGGDGSIGMTLAGNFDDVFMSNVEDNGSLVVNAPSDNTYNPNFIFSGRASVGVTVNATTLVGQAEGVFGTISNSSHSFNVVSDGASSTTSGTWYNTGATTVQDNATPINGDVFTVRDAPGNKFLEVTDNGSISVKSNAADSSSAAAFVVNTIPTWSTAGAKLLRLLNSGSEKLYVDPSGSLWSANNVTANSFTATAGAGTASGSVPVTIFASKSTTCSVTSGETTVLQYPMPANTWSADAQRIAVHAAWQKAANTNSVTAKLYFNNIAYVSLTSSSSGDTMFSDFVATRTGSGTYEYDARNSTTGLGLTANRGNTTATMTGPIDIHTTVTGATAAGDLCGSYLRVEWIP